MTIFAIVNGFVKKKNDKILAPGDIVKTGTIIKLAKQFKLKKKLTLIRVEKMINNKTLLKVIDKASFAVLLNKKHSTI